LPVYSKNEIQQVCKDLLYQARISGQPCPNPNEKKKQFIKALRLASLGSRIPVSVINHDDVSPDGIPYTNDFGNMYCDGLELNKDSTTKLSKIRETKKFKELKLKDGTVNASSAMKLLMMRWARKPKRHYFIDLWNTIMIVSRECELHPHDFITARGFWFSKEPKANSKCSFQVECQRTDKKIRDKK